MATFQVLSLRDPDLRTQTYRTRREHSKVKSGCLTCRTKRVKCDELKPVCARCNRNQRICLYQPHDGSTHPPSKQRGSSGLMRRRPYDGAMIVGPWLSTALGDMRDNQLLQHFLTSTKEILNIYQNDGLISLSKSSPLVRNTILAASASHLRHVAPDVKEYCFAEQYYQSLIIANLQKALDTPQLLLGQDGAKALLLSMVLLNIISFANLDHEQEEPEDSWISSTRDDRLNWLALQAGTRPALLSLTAYIADIREFLGPMFMGEEKKDWRPADIADDLSHIPQTWIEVFELQDSSPSSGCDAASSDPTDLYRLAVLHLLRFQAIEPVATHAHIYFMFLNKLTPEFRGLLCQRDPRALWLLGYWMGLMCRFEPIWWLTKRVTKNYEAITVYLQQLDLVSLPGVEGSRWAEMMEHLRLASTFYPVSVYREES